MFLYTFVESNARMRDARSWPSFAVVSYRYMRIAGYFRLRIAGSFAAPADTPLAELLLSGVRSYFLELRFVSRVHFADKGLRRRETKMDIT